MIEPLVKIVQLANTITMVLDVPLVNMESMHLRHRTKSVCRVTRVTTPTIKQEPLHVQVVMLASIVIIMP